MQRGFMKRVCRKRGPDVWQFRWSETGPEGTRTHHKKVVGTVEQYSDEHSARRAVVGLVAEINTDLRLPNSRTITVGELCDHFEQRELGEQNTWRSHATKKMRSVGTEFKVMQELLRHSSLRSTLDIYTQAISPAKHQAQAAVLSLVFSSDTLEAEGVTRQGAAAT